MNSIYRYGISLVLVVLTGCASVPTMPSVMALPGTTKSFDQFKKDDTVCRSYAYQEAGGQLSDRAAQESGLSSAAIGTVLGAASGALIGGGSGAGVGAGMGLVFGGLAGTDTSLRTSMARQSRFDMRYVQCMYAAGHRVPVWERFTEAATGSAVPPPDTAAPPPDIPPPPPPR